jgi:two-component sensor histidine kinase
MKDLLALLFSTDGFPARWHCGDWSSLHGWVHVCSDMAIFGAYAAIPAALGYFALRRKDVPFLPIFWLFGVFILACGTGHLVEATIFWHPWYRFSAAIKVVTALASWGTVVALVRILPQALELPGMAKLNRELSREIEERKQAEVQREAALDESKMLLREVHHRVKNNMQVISSLLSLHASKLRDSQQHAVFAECRERIRAMALIHERLYTGGRFARIDFGEYLTDMVRMIFGSATQTGGRVRLDLRFDNLHVGSDVAVPLSLIASELVLNATKHAFADGREGTLTVRLRKGGEYNELVVSDDGPGLPADFSSSQSSGIGFDLVESLTRQIRGQRDLTSESGGVTTTIRWPAQKEASSVEFSRDHVLNDVDSATLTPST